MSAACQRFGVLAGLLITMVSGCSHENAGSDKPVSKSSPALSENEGSVHTHHDKGKHQGHEETAGIGEAANPAVLIRDSGWDALRPGVATTITFHLEREGDALKEFELLHERLMHFIVVRDALDEFQHLHPQIASDGTATIDIVFPTAGTYWLYVDCQPKGEGQQTVQHDMQVEGETPTVPGLTPNVPVTVTLGELQTAVSAEKQENEWKMTFRHSDLAGKPLSDLEPWLGAMGHLVVIGEDTGEYVHAHADAQSEEAGKVTFAAHFARPGIYKAWGQFQRKGQVFTVPAVVEVN